jgi:hypothetical protein
MFVRSVTIVGYDLEIERCVVAEQGSALRLEGCTIERQPLPVTAGALGGVPVELEPACDDLVVSLSAAQISAATTTARADARQCGLDAGVHGTIRARIIVDNAGTVTAVETDTGGADVRACIQGHFAAARLPRTSRGATFTVNLVMP